MKFEDLVMSVASIVVISALIHAPIDMAFISAFGLASGPTAATFVTFFISTLICGYIFAGKIREARREAIPRIAILWVAFVYLLLQFKPTQSHWGLFAQEAYQGQNWSALSTIEQLHWEIVYLDIFAFLFVVVALVCGLVGLYVGSMLRKPKPS